MEENIPTKKAKKEKEKKASEQPVLDRPSSFTWKRKTKLQVTIQQYKYNGGNHVHGVRMIFLKNVVINKSKPTIIHNKVSKEGYLPMRLYIYLGGV